MDIVIHALIQFKDILSYCFFECSDNKSKKHIKIISSAQMLILIHTLLLLPTMYAHVPVLLVSLP